METKSKITFIDFDWDKFDTSSSKSEDSKENYGFSFSDIESEDDNYDGADMYNRIMKEKQLQNSYSSTTTRAKTKISDETENSKPKKPKRRKKKKKQKDSNLLDTTVIIDSNTEELKTEVSQQSDVKEVITLEKSDEKPKKVKKKKTNKEWKYKYERFYKNKKKFNLDIIRSEDGPFLFKIQFQYIPKRKKKQNNPNSGNFEPDPDGNSMAGAKLKNKVLQFFKFTQQKVETEHDDDKPKSSISLNYDKIKICKPKNDNVKVFVTVHSREDGVKIYDFYKLRTKRFKAAVYLIISNDILKKHTLKEIQKHKEKALQKQKLEEQKKNEKEKRLDLDSSVIEEDPLETSFSTTHDEHYDGDDDN